MGLGGIPRRIHFVVGKGGVGKSSVAAALALAAGGSLRRVLAVEIGRPDGLARSLGVRPGDAGRFAGVPGAPGLAYGWLEGGAALAAYLSGILPSKRLLRALTRSRTYRYFVAAAPGLGALMVIGQVRHEYRREAGGAPAWDAVIVDAGASARGLGILGMPAAAAEAFPSGRVHREARDVLGYLQDPARTRVHVVATPEEMPLTEAAEILGRLDGALGLPVGAVVVNRCRPPSPPGTREAVEALARALPGGPEASAIRDGVVLAARRSLGWEAVEAEGIHRFEAETGIATVGLPRLEGDAPSSVAWGLAPRVAALLDGAGTPGDTSP